MQKLNLQETDRVRAATDAEVLRQIDEKIDCQIRYYATQPKEVISRRITELEQEWDIERWLEMNASALAFTGVVLGFLSSKKWLLLSGLVTGFLFQHATQGWCPPVPVLRRLGVRTRSEIDREKYALKMLRGDFRGFAPEAMKPLPNQVNDLVNAVRA
jgi:hypothetical protein